MNQMTPPAAGPKSRLDRFLPGTDDGGETVGIKISLGDLRAMAWRQRKVLVLIVGLALLLGIVATMLMTPRYQAAATVKIDNESIKIVEGQDLDPAVAMSDTGRYLNTQVKIVESRSLSTKVADSLKLDRSDAFLNEMGVKVPDEGMPERERAAMRREMVISVLRQGVSMDSAPDSRVASIGFVSRDPVLAAKVANSFAENYINQNVQARYDNNAYARRVLTEQVRQAQIELQQTERDAIDYARRNRLIDTGDASSGTDDGKSGGRDTGNARSVTTANLVQLNASYIDARATRIAAEARWTAAQASNGLDLPEARNNPAIQALQTRRAEIAATLAQLRTRYIESQPQVKEAAAELAQVDAMLANAGRTLKTSIQKEYQAALRAEQDLFGAKEQLANETLTEQDRRVQLNLIARDAETQRKQLNDLLTRLNQINAAADITLNNISLLDKAQVPVQPISPNIRRNLLMALAAGLALALFVAFIREALDDTLRSPEDAERKLHLPLLGTTPFVQEASTQDLEDRQGELAEAYYSIRATVDYASSGDSNKVLLVTSSQPSEGKSTTSIALARDFARIGRRVLLIDADFRNPSLHRNLQLPKEHGFVDVLMKHRSFEDTVLEHEIPGLHMLPLGPIPPNPVQILSSNLIQDFIADKRGQYDILIFDSAPVMGLADAPMLSRMADFVLLIVEANRAHFGQAKSAVRRLQDAGANILGIVMTKFSFRDAGYSYDYHYSYYSYRTKQSSEAPAE